MDRDRLLAPGRWKETALVLSAAAALGFGALAFFNAQGFLLYFGDAEAHLNIARRILDSRTPGADQIGTVWLPLPHLLTMCLVMYDPWWRNGLAGGVPSTIAFIITCVLLYASVRRLFPGRATAITALVAFALNPNILYLQSIPMTESIFFAAWLGMVYGAVVFAQKGSLWPVLFAAACSNAASMTRYEGWFLIPFLALFFLAHSGRRWWIAFLFGALACIGPAAWLAHNWWHYLNPIEFYNGPYSAKGIYERALNAGSARAPGDGNWREAIQYFWAAARLCAGAPLAWLGLLGAVIGIAKGRRWIWILLALPPVFYVWSVHSSGANIFVPHLWPHSYYNTRYGSTLLPVLALGAAALVAAAPTRVRPAAAAIMIAASLLPWIFGPDRSIVLKESQVNSAARREWTRIAADYMRRHYAPGEGVFTAFGDLTGIFRSAHIPLSETLHDGNNPYWTAAQMRADLFLHEQWAVALSGDAVATAIQRANRRRPLYELVARIEVPKAPVVEVYHRTGGSGAMRDLCRNGLIQNCETPVDHEP